MSSSEAEESSKKDSDSDSDSSQESEEEVEEDPLKVEPPTFSVPEGDEYEVWTIRMPFDVDHTALDGIQISLDKDRKQLGSVQSKDEKYGVVLGDAFETESFRVLEADDGKFLKLAHVPITKHLNIVHADGLKEIPETTLAPGIDRAPEPVDPVRKAYAAVPQKAGLKRRFMPLGGPTSNDLSQTDEARKLVTGFAAFQTARKKQRLSSSTPSRERRDASPIKSPKAKRRRNDMDIDEEATPASKAISDSDESDDEEKKKKLIKKVKKEKKSEEKKAKKTKKRKIKV